MTWNIGKVGYVSGLAAFSSAVAYDVVQILQVAGFLRFPADEILIYGTSLWIVVPLILEMLAFHHLTQPDKRFWTHAADAIPLLEQTPHSLFWEYDAIGYVSLGLACLLAVPAVRNVGFERWLRVSLIAHAVITPIISTVYFYPTFSTKLLLLGFPWVITAPLFMLMLAIMLRRRHAATS